VFLISDFVFLICDFVEIIFQLRSDDSSFASEDSNLSPGSVRPSGRGAFFGGVDGLASGERFLVAFSPS